MASPPWRLVAVAFLTILSALTMPSAQAAGDATTIKRWSSDADFRSGTASGLTVSGGNVSISKPQGSFSVADPYGDGKARTFSYSTWTSPWVSTGFDGKTIIPSWNVTSAPNGTWARVQIRAKTATTTGSWDMIANWAYGTGGMHRQSGPAGTDDISRLDVDTLLANGTNRFRAWQIKIFLVRPQNSTLTPTLSSLGAVASTFSTRSRPVSTTTMTASKELAVPRYSQMIHRGEYPQWGGGGASWCSPTSTSMVLRYFGAGPKPADYSWSPYADSWVDHAARYTYDHRYDGAGNWPFNTAYAGRFGLDAFVTRLANMRDAEAFIRAGIPVVASVRYARGALTGSPVASSAGHLLVITGVMKDGRVIANDPAASSNSTVRRVYDRAQFERAWIGGSGGVSYIIRPTSKPLPADTARW